MTDNAPRPSKPAFDCPHCGAYAQVTSGQLQGPGGYIPFQGTKCGHCSGYCFWSITGSGIEARHTMIYPLTRGGVPAHEEMPEAARTLYDEARDVAGRSPRAAVALLRVAVDVLLREVVPDAGRRSLNDVIRLAVVSGLNPSVQQALDVLRVIGNDAVHPEAIVLDEQDPQAQVVALSRLLNLVVEQMVAVPRLAREMTASLPAGVLDGIRRRDS